MAQISYYQNYSDRFEQIRAKMEANARRYQSNFGNQIAPQPEQLSPSESFDNYSQDIRGQSAGLTFLSKNPDFAQIGQNINRFLVTPKVHSAVEQVDRISGNIPRMLIPAHQRINFKPMPQKSLIPPPGTLPPNRHIHEIVERERNSYISNDSINEFSRKTSRKPKKLRPYFALGVVIVMFTLLMFGMQNRIIQETINYVMGELKEGTYMTEAWKYTPVPVNLCFHLFDLRNGPQFLEGAKPYLDEVGPFCYLVRRNRTIVEWTPQTLVFKERIVAKFDVEHSISLDTSIRMINYPIFISVMYVKNFLERYNVGFIGPVVYNGLATALRLTGEDLVDVTTARLLLEGKPIRILSYLSLFLEPLRSVGVPIPKYFGGKEIKLMNHSFGFISTLTSSEMGPYEVYRKNEDRHHLAGDIVAYREKSTYSSWAKPCNRMEGGDGMFWHRPVLVPKLTIYSKMPCRLLPFVRENSRLFQGAQVVRYNMDTQMFNMTVRENQCFCSKYRRLRECNGWQDISGCLYSLPIGFSFPHFYQSPNLLRQVVGLSPSKDLHESYIEMEPLIGILVHGRVGIQALIDIQPVSLLLPMSSIDKVLYPIMWIQVGGRAEGWLAVLLFFGSNGFRYGAYLSLFGGLFISSFLFNLEYKQRHW